MFEICIDKENADPVDVLRAAANIRGSISDEIHTDLLDEAQILSSKLDKQWTAMGTHRMEVVRAITGSNAVDKVKQINIVNKYAAYAQEMFDFESQFMKDIFDESLNLELQEDRTKCCLWLVIVKIVDKDCQQTKRKISNRAFRAAAPQETRKILEEMHHKHVHLIEGLWPFRHQLPNPDETTTNMVDLYRKLTRRDIRKYREPVVGSANLTIEIVHRPNGQRYSEIDRATDKRPLAEPDDKLTRTVDADKKNKALRWVQALMKDTRGVQDRHKAITKMTLALVAPGETTVPTWQKITVSAMGAFFLLILLVIAFLVPNPTEHQFLVFRVVLALAAGGIGALIPGFIEVRYRNWMRAGGAMALFAIVLFVNPPSLITDTEQSSDTSRELEDGTEAGDT